MGEQYAADIGVIGGSFEIEPLGDSAATIRFGNRIDPAISRRVGALAESLRERAFPWAQECIETYATVTVFYDALKVAAILRSSGFCALNEAEPLFRYVSGELTGLVHSLPEKAAKEGRIVPIPVCYGGVYGPDLSLLAAGRQMSVDEAVRLHSKPLYHVYMIGFVPGFPYLGGLDPRLAAPRLARPRLSVPAGTVGIAGEQTGVYPLATPGGWNLIGRTPLRLFDPARQEPSLLQAGDRVRFVPIPERQFVLLKEDGAWA